MSGAVSRSLAISLLNPGNEKHYPVMSHVQGALDQIIENIAGYAETIKKRIE